MSLKTFQTLSQRVGPTLIIVKPESVCVFTLFITFELGVPSISLGFVVYPYINKHALPSVFNAVVFYTIGHRLSSLLWFVHRGSCRLPFGLTPLVI